MTLVKFQDPIAKEEISYSISEKLIPKWSNHKKMVVDKNRDRVYVVSGRERSGKSTWTFQQAKYIDKNFCLDRICFTPEQFLTQIRTAPEGSVVVFDEAFKGFSSRASLSKVNKILVQGLMEVGRRNLIIFIVLPEFSLLENYVAIHRSHALFYIYERKDLAYRGWRCYNRKKKRVIYFKSKKNYGIMPYTPTKLKGKFFTKRIMIDNKNTPTPYVTFDLKGYDDKKAKAFGGKPEEVPINPFEIEVKKLKYILCKIKCPIKTKKELAEKVGVSYNTLKGWRRLEKEGKSKEKG